MAPRTIDDASEAAEALKGELFGAARIVVMTGAGLSTESGILDFRSPDGVWSRMDPIDFDDFCNNELARLEDWRRRFEMADLFYHCEPNAAHRAMANFAKAGGVDTIITQNIDGLHARAGTPPERLIELHGNGDHAHCLSCSTRYEIADAQRIIAETGEAPRCGRCGGLLKAAIVSFGEPMPKTALQRAQRAAMDCDLFIAAGTSLVVYPATALPLLSLERPARASSSPRATRPSKIALPILLFVPRSQRRSRHSNA